MKIKYLNGDRLYYGVLAGGNAVIADQVCLNKINVFPVPDSDTGTNLASTMKSIAERASADKSFKSTLQSIAHAALAGARGNSGLIFAQFLLGLSREFKEGMKASTKSFGEAVHKATHYAYKAIITPVEGTMVTVIKDWAHAVYQKRTQTSDFVELLSHSLHAARQSLKDTPKKLAVLARAGVVDAGAKGFVDFLEGIIDFIKTGKIRHISLPKVTWSRTDVHKHTSRASITSRYCTEAMIDGVSLDLDRLRMEIQRYGESAIVAGSEETARVHIHTNAPREFFQRLHDYGDITHVKVDDMINQYDVSHNPKARIALVTDSSCDLPDEILQDFQIQMIPVNLMFGRSQFLDKVTITPDQFYTMLRTQPLHPTTSLPSLETVQNCYAFLASHFESLVCIHLSDKLSGTFQACETAAREVGNGNITVVNSKSISIALGLIVLRAAEAIRSGKTREEILRLVEEWIGKSKVLVDLQTLKYMVRSGRISPLKGVLAKMLNIKPIITIDSEGRATDRGKSFSRRSNMRKILRMVVRESRKGKIWKYAVVHAQNPGRAEAYKQTLTEQLGFEPDFVMDVAPVIGVHVGVGAVAVAFMME